MFSFHFRKSARGTTCLIQCKKFSISTFLIIKIFKKGSKKIIFYSPPLLSNKSIFTSFMLLLKKRERKTNTKGIEQNLNSVPVLGNQTMLCGFEQQFSFSEELNFLVIFHAGLILWSKDCNQTEGGKEKQLFCESSHSCWRACPELLTTKEPLKALAALTIELSNLCNSPEHAPNHKWILWDSNPLPQQNKPKV